MKKRRLFARMARSRPGTELIGRFMKALVHALIATLRIRLQLEKEAERLLGDMSCPVILAFWHDQLLLAPLVRKIVPSRPLAILISKSRDGLFATRLAETYFDVEVVQVAHSQRAGALRDTIRGLQEGRAFLITPDGPRGPRHMVKPGILFSAERAGAKIIPYRWQASRSITLSSWDRLHIPLPFSRVTVTCGEPIACLPGMAQEQLGALLASRLSGSS